MLEQLKELSQKAYVPYSGFPVAAIVVVNGGETFSGVNVENASYSLTICAERVAIVGAIVAGYTSNDFAEIHIMGKNGEGFVPPCGACRQFMSEFFAPSKRVYIYSNERVEEYQVSTLLPHAFSNKDL